LFPFHIIKIATTLAHTRASIDAIPEKRLPSGIECKKVEAPAPVWTDELPVVVAVSVLVVLSVVEAAAVAVTVLAAAPELPLPELEAAPDGKMVSTLLRLEVMVVPGIVSISIGMISTTVSPALSVVVSDVTVSAVPCPPPWPPCPAFVVLGLTVAAADSAAAMTEEGTGTPARSQATSKRPKMA